MRDSPTDQPTIVEVLAGFVRNNAQNGTDLPDAYGLRRPADVLAALTVIGRRNTSHDVPEPNREAPGTGKVPDLSMADLSHLDLRGFGLWRTPTSARSTCRACC